MVIKTKVAQSFEEEKDSLNPQSATVDLAKKYRTPRTFGSTNSFVGRSSSIQSIKSKKSATGRRKGKKKPSQTGSSFKIAHQSQRNSNSDESNRSGQKSIRSRSSQNSRANNSSKEIMNLDKEETKASKGLSSFAKIKKKSRKIRKVKTDNPINRTLQKKFNSETIKIIKVEDLNAEVPTHNEMEKSMPLNESPKIRMERNRPPRSPPSKKKNYLPQIDEIDKVDKVDKALNLTIKPTLDALPVNPSAVENIKSEAKKIEPTKPILKSGMDFKSVDIVNMHKIETEKLNKTMLSAKDKRAIFRNNNRKSAMSKQVTSFVNVFNSFGEDDLMTSKLKRSRHSSNLLRDKSKSSQNSHTSNSERRSKHRSNKDARKMHLNSDKSIRIHKNWSRSLVLVDPLGHLETESRKTLSDFHELIKVKIGITHEMETGKNLLNRRPRDKQYSVTSEGSLGRDDESVSDHSVPEMPDNSSPKISDKGSKSSRNVKSNISDSDHSSSESENVHSLVRFYSLPILPSEKECLQIKFDDALEVLHKTSFNKTGIDDFILLRAVSHGAYGKVCLARKKQTRDLFAIKIMDKKKMEEKGVTEQIINERNILNKVNNDYIVRGVYTFQTSRFLYIVMEYMKGGDFSGLLENLGAMDETSAKTYLAQIVVAIEYLHSLGIIHRDLKPDNILIDGSGFIKLTDFGLSEINMKNIKDQYELVAIKNNVDSNPFVNMDMSDSDSSDDEPPLVNMGLMTQESVQKREDAFKNKIRLTQNLDNIKNKNIQPKNRSKIIGTPDYIAPEVINGEEVTKNVDWWALGVIAYEFMTGNLPFHAPKWEKIFENIQQKNIRWPEDIDNALSKEAIDFMKSLMTYEVDQRLGSKGVHDVRNHPFFNGIDWDNLDKSDVPFKPEVDNEIDTTFFTDSKKFDMKELEEIQNDMNNFSNDSFGHFDSTVIDTLAEINKKEAHKAIMKATNLSRYKSEMQELGQSQNETDKAGYEFDSLLSNNQ